MIKGKYRFHGHAGLRYVYRKSASVRSRLLVIRYVVNTRRRTPRLAVVVSKKVLKSAVGRNRIRRRIYELLRLEIPELANYDLAVIVTSAEARDVAATELQSSIKQLLTEAGVYKKN